MRSLYRVVKNLLPLNINLSRAGALTAFMAMALPLAGCTGSSDYPVIFPHGPDAITERDLLFIAVAIMLIVVIPVFVLAVWLPLRYRASREAPDYDPNWDHSHRAEVVIWLVPALIVCAIGSLVWIYTHRLDPYRSQMAEGKPVVVQAVSIDWKWLFIYPQQHLATVNELVLPTDRPVSLRLTSTDVMTSFFVPGLTSQIYAMAGMGTRLNFQPGPVETYTGRNSLFDGKGFPDQKFPVRIVTAENFKNWIDTVRKAPLQLTPHKYQMLSKSGAMPHPLHFSSADPELFARIVKGEHSAASMIVSDRPK